MEQSTRSKDIKRVEKVVNATLLHFGSLKIQNNEDTIDESSLSMSSFGMSLVQPLFAGD